MKTSKIELYINNELQSSFPIYSDKISIEKERESNEMYFRTKISATITFVGADFRAIYNSDIDTSFSIRVYDSETNTFLARGTFEKTDCKFNVDDEICEAKISSADDYDKILGGKDNEYDIVSLAPMRETITLRKRAILQIYVFHDTKITNIFGNTSYEIDVASGIDVDQLVHNDLINTYNFTQIETEGIEVYVTEMPSGYESLLGVYIGSYNGSNTILRQINGVNTITTFADTGRRRLYWVFRDGDNNIATIDGQYITTEPVQRVPRTTDLNHWGYEKTFMGNMVKWQTDERMIVGADEKSTYARILIDSIPEDGTNVKELLAEDICETNLNYHYSMKVPSDWGLSNLVVRSMATQEEPTKWGVDGHGEYFTQPEPMNSGDNVIPIGWSRWIPKSLWLNSTTRLSDSLDYYETRWDFQDAYPLWSVIQVLLKKIDSDITFEGTSEYSEFLYGNSVYLPPIVDFARQLLYITPITNIKKTYYSQAARKGNLSLTNILTMLRNTCQLYWFIDEQKRLRIEHITWFKNGGAYESQDPIIDLTEVKSPMSMKPWDFSMNTISYNKSSLTKRYEFGWDAQCTEAFDGYAIDIHNKYVSHGNTTKASVAKFISDIDLIMCSPKVFSDDSFALIGVNPSSKLCPIVTPNILSEDFVAPRFKLQNGYMSFYFLEVAYWAYDLGGDYASIGDFKNKGGDMGVLRVYDTKRAKVQSVKFPIEASMVGKEGLVRTSMGDGEWTKAKYTLEDGMMEMDLILPTEDDVPIAFGEFEGEGVTMERNGNTITFHGNEADNGWGCVRIKFNIDVMATMVADTEANYDIGWANPSKMTTIDGAKLAYRSVSGWEDTTFAINKGRTFYFGYIKDVSQSEFGDTITITFVAQ